MQKSNKFKNNSRMQTVVRWTGREKQMRRIFLETNFINTFSAQCFLKRLKGDFHQQVYHFVCSNGAVNKWLMMYELCIQTSTRPILTGETRNTRVWIRNSELPDLVAGIGNPRMSTWAFSYSGVLNVCQTKKSKKEKNNETTTQQIFIDCQQMCLRYNMPTDDWKQ
jgi:hypothetical protein